MEYLYHFDLTQDPFQNESDLRFLFASETHRRAQLRIDRALRQSKGLAVLAGDGGTGKSLLARSLFEDLEEEVFEASLLMMMQGSADAASVLRRLCRQLGEDEPPSERPALLATLYDQLAIVREDGRHAVLIIDDAHVLGGEAMAEVGGLLNLEYEDRRMLSLLLVGTPGLDEIVTSVPSLGDRVDVRVWLQSLSESESSEYIAHRIQVAGGSPEIFAPGALKAIYTLGGGRPRRMNTLADNALFEAFLAGRKQVGEDEVRRAGADLSFEPLVPAGQPDASESFAAMAEPLIDIADPLDDDSAIHPSRDGFSVSSDAGDTLGEIQLDDRIDPGDLAGNGSGAMAKADRRELRDESLEAPLDFADTTDSDDIDDLFEELLDN